MRKCSNLSHEKGWPISLFGTGLVLALLVSSCGASPEKNPGYQGTQSELSLHDGNSKYVRVDKNQTVLTWKGSSIEGAHNGYVSISKGELMVEEGQLKGGAVQVDMKTILDDKRRNDNNLIRHLKDADFFDVAKFPFSTFVIDRVDPAPDGSSNISGSLTIKGITHPVSFPATISSKDGGVRATAKMVIDRTRWGIHYRSGKFFANLADKAISDSITFNISIVGKR